MASSRPERASLGLVAESNMYGIRFLRPEGETWQPEKAIVEGDASIDLGLEGVKQLVPQRDQTDSTFIQGPTTLPAASPWEPPLQFAGSSRVRHPSECGPASGFRVSDPSWLSKSRRSRHFGMNYLSTAPGSGSYRTTTVTLLLPIRRIPCYRYAFL